MPKYTGYPAHDPDNCLNRGSDDDWDIIMGHVDLSKYDTRAEDYSQPEDDRQLQDEWQREEVEREALQNRVEAMLRESGYHHPPALDRFGKPATCFYHAAHKGMFLQVDADRVFLCGSQPMRLLRGGGFRHETEFQATGTPDEICAALGAWLKGWREWWLERAEIPDFWRHKNVRVHKPCPVPDIGAVADTGVGADCEV